MKKVRFCILGAGPSGLAFAATLARAKCDSFVVLEKEAVAGGLCRSAMVDGSPLDIGGGHFLDLRRTKVLDFLFRYMPRAEWAEFDRVATIRIRSSEVEHPLEGNLWQLPVADQIDFLESIAVAPCNRGEPEPATFAEWIRWKLGSRIADEYMVPYNQKLWSIPLTDLASDWIHKLPSVSFRQTLESCLVRKAGGALPAHGRFLYPRAHGYGEVWTRIAASLGDRFIPNYTLRSIDVDQRMVNDDFQADVLVSTIPWHTWKTIAPLPAAVTAAVDGLVHTSVDVDYHGDNLPSRAHWIYEPDENLRHHRLLLRHNFCAGSRGHWTEANAKRSGAATGPRFHNPYAYPVSTVGKEARLATILDWASAHAIVGLGRWGTWEHINSDVAVEQAMASAERYLGSP